MTPEFILLAVLFFLVAALYGSVGLGGGSSYVAILALAQISSDKIPSTALALNIIVSGMAFWSYWRKGAINRSLTLPFLLTSVPAALVGGLLPIDPYLLRIVLASVLLPTGLLLFVRDRTSNGESERTTDRRWEFSAIMGLGIGFLGGITGIGGGVFLIPLLLMLRYAPAKEVSGLAAAFVLLNSAAAFLGHLYRSNVYPELVLPLIGAVTLGGFIGSWTGANWLRPQTVRRIAGIVVLFASLQIFAGLF